MIIKKLAVALIVVSAAGVASADDFNFAPYVIGGVGYSHLNSDTTGTASDDSDTTSYSLGMGANLSKNWAIEARYVNTGTYSAVVTPYTVDIKGKGPALGLIGFLPVSDRISLYARVDAVRLNVTADVSTLGSSSESHTDLGYGVGAQYRLDYGFAVRAQIDRLRIKFEGMTSDLDTASVNILKAF